MKKFLIFFILFLSARTVVKAQIDTFIYATQNLALHHIWGGLDTSEIKSGILINKFPAIDNKIKYQNGTLNDSSVTLNHWASFYNTLYFGTIDTIRAIPDINEIISMAENISVSTSSIPLGLINFNYNGLKDSALILDLIQIVENHKFIRQATTATPSPYYFDSVFSICPINIKSSSLSVCFNLDSQLVFTNRDDNIIKYEVAFENDSTYTTFFLNTSFCKSFNEYGNKLLNFRCITTNSDTFYCKTIFTISERDAQERNNSCGSLIEPDEGPTTLYYFPGLPDSYYANEPIPNQTLSAMYGVWYGCNLPTGVPNTTLIRKPILFVTGFNPKNSKTMLCWDEDVPFNTHFPQNMLDFAAEKIWRGTYYETFNGATWPDFRGELSHTSYWDQINSNNEDYLALKMQFNGTSYLQKLREKGFDIWVLAVNNGEDRAQHNALLVAQMIKQINNHYIVMSQTEELIVTGYSAGAWASRYALTMMEKYHNDNLNTQSESLYPHHRTKLWLSYEGEFYGANTPIGFQEFVKFMAGTFNPDFVTSVTGGLVAATFAPLLLSVGATPFLDNTILSQTNTILNNPASQQLSRYVAGNGNARSTPALALNTNINALNPATRGYPEWCRKVALAQGSGVGIETTNGGDYAPRFSPEGIMFSVEQQPYLPIPLGALPARYAISRWNKNGASTIFRGKTGFRAFVAGVPVGFVQSGTETIIAGNYKGWDYCPGSTQATANIMYNNLGFIKDPINVFNNFNYTQTMHSFAPTAGMFDIRTPESNYTQEENVFVNLDSKYDFFQIKKILPSGNPDHSLGHRYGYPHLISGNNIGGTIVDSKMITPFDGICAVGDPNLYQTILPNHFHVDDFQPDFLDFLLGEMADENVYIQNRDIGNNTPNYIAGFHAVNKVYCGKNVYQKHCNEWRDKEGDVIIDQEAQVDMRGTEIVFTTGVSVTGGASLHARLGNTLNCNEDMSQRNSNIPSNSVTTNTNNNFKNNGSKETFQDISSDVDLIIYPNPVSQITEIFAELINSVQGYLQIFDVTGKAVFAGIIFSGKNQIQIPADCKGIYIVKIKTIENRFFNKKLVVY